MDEFDDFINTMEREETHVIKPDAFHVPFIYKGLSGLESLEALESWDISFVYIVLYTVNTSLNIPFLEFGLKKIPYVNVNELNDLMTFSFFIANNPTECVEMAHAKIKRLLQSKTNMNHAEETVDETKYTIHGYKVFEKNMYLFVNVDRWKENNVMSLSRNEILWFVTSNEIVNAQSCCRFKIDTLVNRFFIHNDSFLYLFDSAKDALLESPIVVYTGHPYSKVSFTAIFGVSKEEYSSRSVLGPYYYFTDYQSAFKLGGWSKTGEDEYMYDKLITFPGEKGKYTRGGIIRFALFLGNAKMLMNVSTDDIDNSLMRRQLLPEEQMNVRTTDYDGIWSEIYDSVYLGPVVQEDGSQIHGGPYWAAKDYSQFTALSYHTIDRKTLGDAWSLKGDYFIM